MPPLYLGLCLLLGTGCIAGFLAGLLGIGGGVVIVPFLVLVLEQTHTSDSFLMHVAVSTSLATIVVTGITSARAHYKKGALDLPLLRFWAPFIICGAFIGGLLGGRMDARILTGLFALVLCVVSARMLLDRQLCPSISGKEPSTVKKRFPAFLIGFFAALMGIGGGCLSVPTLTFLGRPIHKAIGTSSAFGVLLALPGALGFAISGWSQAALPPGNVGYVNLPSFLLISASAILTTPIGVAAAHKLNARPLKRIFGLFLLLAAFKLVSRLF